MARGRIIDTGNPGNIDSGTGDSDSVLAGAVDPIAIDAADSDSGSTTGGDNGSERTDTVIRTGRGRGRPRGTGNNSSSVKKVDLSGLDGLLIGFHSLLATQVPELALDKAEAVSLRETAEKVARHYNIKTTQKTIDWAAFIGAVGWVYGTRIIAINMRLKTQKPNNVVPIRNAPPARANGAVPPPQHAHEQPPAAGIGNDGRVDPSKMTLN